uniref:H15 domain-containing protein n=1 Tax=Loxodonta africana TaxID=9785 RepID=G3U3F1_LOXAF
NPTVLCVVLEALQVGEQQQGTLVASEHYIPQKYSTASIVRLKYLLKQALANGTNQGLLMRLLNSKAREVTSGFKLFSKKKRLIHPGKMSTIVATKNTEAKEKDPNNPSKARKDPPDPGEVKMVVKKLGKVRSVLPKPDIANEKDPNKGGKAKAKVAKVSEAKKPHKPEKTKKDPPSAAGLSRKSMFKGSTSSQKMLRVPRNANTGSKNSKAKVTKGKNQQEDSNLAKVPKEAAAQGAGKELKAKATAVLKGKGSSGSKTVPVDLAKTEAPKDPRRPGLAAKASLSKASIKKAKV